MAKARASSEPVGTANDSESDDEEDSKKFDMLPELQLQLESILWYHPYLTRHQSDAILQAAEQGVYLMRKRNRAGWGLYSLDIRGQQSVKHFPVTLSENGVSLGSKGFQNVTVFTEYFQSSPVLVDESGTFIECKFPYPAQVNEFGGYQQVTCHFLYGDDDSDEEDSSNKIGYSAATKEGYMKKQGGMIKTRKTRWFVLKDLNLSYYSNHKSKKPIKVIPLQEIVHILGDDSSKNFRIVLPWRTFFVEAPTLQNKREWMDILRWKMSELEQKKSKE